MALVQVESALLHQILSELKAVRRIVAADQDKPKWVKLSTILKETKKGREWARQQRENIDGIARLKTNGRYEYNLTEFLKIAA